MKKAIIVLLLAAVIIVAAVALFVWPSRQFKAALDDGLAMLKANEDLKIESAGYRSASYSLLGGKASVEGLTFKFKTGVLPAEYNLGSIKGSGVPLGVVTSLLRGDTGMFIKGFKAFDELEIKNLYYKTSDEERSLDYKQEASKIKGVMFKPAQNIPDFKRNPAEFLKLMANNLSYKSSEDRGLEAVISNGEKLKMVVKMAQGGSNGYDDYKLDQAFAKDLSLVLHIPKDKYDYDTGDTKTVTDQLQINVAGFSADNLDFSRVFKLMTMAASGDKQALAQQMQNSNMLLPYYGYGQLEFGPMEILWNNNPVSQMERFLTAGPVAAGKFPPKTTSAIKGLVVDFSQMPIAEYKWNSNETLKALKAMGYTKIKADFNAEMLYSEADQTWEIKQYLLEVAEAFKLDLDFKLSSFNLGDEDTPLMTTLMGLVGLSLDNARVTWTDQGLASRLKSYYGPMLTGHEDPAAFTDFLLYLLDEQAAAELRAILENPVPVMAEIKAFVSEPKQISLASGNVSPLALVALSRMDKIEIIRALRPNLTVNDRAPVEISPVGGYPVPSDLDDDNIFLEEDIDRD